MLLLWQRKHFTQANETPFANEKWRKILQDDSIQDMILDGTYDLDEKFPLEAKELLLQMQRPKELKEAIKDETTIEDFRTYIKNMKERTSSSPSGRHYGHYKILYSMHPNYLRVIHGTLQLAINKCIILDRWKKTVTTLLEKKEGNPFIHKF